MKYNKIHRLGKDEVRGILDHYVVVQEKIDGANASIWAENGNIYCGSRNHVVEGFNGLEEYAKSHEGIRKVLEESPKLRLFGEWLVKHTIQYNEDAFKHFYLFDIYDPEADEYLATGLVDLIADSYNIRRPKTLAKGILTEEQIMEHVGKSSIGQHGEGVVIKAEEFVSPFGVKPQYAKIVTPEFLEKNALVFGNGSKEAQNCIEMALCSQYITPARVKKVIQKIESMEDRALDLPDCSRVGNTVYHDFIEEEAWSAMAKKNKRVCFRTLGSLCKRRAILIFKGFLNGEDMSVAFINESEDL